MQYVKKWIADSEYIFLEVIIYDEQDIEELSNYTSEKNVIISLDNIKFLKSFNQIEKLIITSGQPSYDMDSVFRDMTYLRSLKIDYEEVDPSTNWCIDISVFPRLEYLFSRSSYNFCGVSDSKTLKTLIVMKWYQNDLLSLKNSSLDSLCIYGGRLKCLKGIEDTAIKILSLSNLRGLYDISWAKQLPLKILEIENCNKIIDFEEFYSEDLEYLMIYGKNQISSGNFILKYKNLKRILLDVMIIDGDLNSFDNLEHAVILTDKKHFNRKNKELPKSLTKYEIENIPDWRYIYSNRNI